KSFASTLCGTIVHSVATVAFGNYLSATTGLFLTFFRSPDKDDTSWSAQLRRYIILTASSQLLGVICLMTYMTTRFFMLNNDVLPELLRRCSIVMYSICAASALTNFVRIIYVTCVTSRSKSKDNLMPYFFEPLHFSNNPYVDNTYLAPYGANVNSHAANIKSQAEKEAREKETHHLMLSGPLTIIQIIFFTIIYIIQMIFQISMKIKYPSVGYMYTFQMIYLHVGYVSFYLYCDEGYLSSSLLFISNFALGNVLHGAFFLAFGEMKYN
ncbi:6649_t:CDS:2, partial [Dentiscutata heterogama]